MFNAQQACEQASSVIQTLGNKVGMVFKCLFTSCVAIKNWQIQGRKLSTECCIVLKCMDINDL